MRLFQCNRSAARERRRNLISGQEQRSSPHGIARQSRLGRNRYKAGSPVILPQWRFASNSPPRIGCCAGAEPACRGPHPRGRRYARGTSARRRSGPRSRPDTIGQSADDDTFVAVARHRSELQHPAPDRFIGDVEPGGGDRRASGHESKEYRRGMLNRPIYRHLRGGPVPSRTLKNSVLAKRNVGSSKVTLA